MKFQRFQLDLEKEEEADVKLPTSVGSLIKQKSSIKTSISALLTMLKPLTLWITTKWKILKEMGILQVKKQQLELDMEQWTGSRLGKEYIKAVYCHPAYLTYMQSTSCEMLGWMKHRLSQDCRGKYQ